MTHIILLFHKHSAIVPPRLSYYEWMKMINKLMQMCGIYLNRKKRHHRYELFVCMLMVLTSQAFAANITVNTDTTWKVSGNSPTVSWESDLQFDESNWDYATDITAQISGGDPKLTYIWNGSISNDSMQTWYRGTFNIDDPVVTSASLYGGVDDDAIIYVNGIMILNDSSNTANPFGPIDIKPYLHSGTNLIAATAIDAGGVHAFSIQAGIVTAPTQAPTAITGAASSADATSATLNGTVSANGASTAVNIQYGLTTDYGSDAIASQSPLSSTASGTAVSATVSGLTCGSMYHFRVVGQNSSGTATGNDETFTTTACPVNGACGSSNGKTYPVAPSTDLCLSGVSSSGPDSWNWICTGLYGGLSTACSATQLVFTSTAVLSITAGASGNFTVTTNAGTPIPALSYTGTLPNGISFIDNGNGTATFSGNPVLGTVAVYPLTISATNDGGTVNQSFTLTINKIDQAITFGTTPSLIYGGTTGTVSATGGASGLPVTFTSLTTDICTISDATVTPVSAGTCIIAADQEGDANFNAAIRVSQEFSVTPPVTACNTPVVSGIVSWWKGDGSASDHTGANSGTLQNGAVFTSGKVGQAFSFNGNRQYVVVPDSESLDLTTQFTLQAWIKPASVIDVDAALLSKVGGVDGNNGYQLSISPSLIPTCQFNANGEGWSANHVTAGLVSQDTWTHVSCTYDNDTLRMHINGILVGSNFIGAKSVINSSSTLRISGDDNDHVYFNGLIDEVQIYNRAITANEVSAIYNTGNGSPCVAITVPDAPSIGTAVASNSQATISFSPPANDGGAAINIYTAKSTPGGFTATGTTSPITITGLTNGIPYTFTVTATNSVGTSPESAHSNAVTGIPTLSVSVISNGSGTGTGGTVTSSPAGISCTSGSCTNSFNETVSLFATPSILSNFGGWGGGVCSGTGACNVTMDGDKTVTATFNAAALLHIGGTEYRSLQEAYDAAADGAVIQLLQSTVTGTLDANKAITIKLNGGYDAGYSSTPGTTAVTAPFSITLGKVVVDRIVIP